MLPADEQLHVIESGIADLVPASDMKRKLAKGTALRVKLGVDPTECIAFEDSPGGADSASAAGCFVVAIPSVAPIEPAERRIVLPTLVGIDLPFLRSLFD